jgi:hypothetical protein
MPETFGKRMRKDAQAKKAAAREERRVARNERKEQRASGDVDPMDWLAQPEPEDESLDRPNPDLDKLEENSSR